MPLADKQLTQEHEKVLWNAKELDLDTSKGLLHAVIFYLIKCFAVWQGKELRQLQTSHISFGEDKLGKYAALDLQSSIFKKRGVVKRYDDPANPRSVYKILKKYRSRIANEGPFLVRPISSIKDFICFGPLPLGVRVIKSFISTLMEDAGIGRCFVNYSLNLQSINTLMRFGTGYHCLSSWLVKGNEKCLPTFPVCSSTNCEDINPEISVMISRLLDAPYPYDAVEMIQKMEHENEQTNSEKDSELSPKFNSWMSNIMTGNNDKEKDDKQELTTLVSESMNLTEIERESSSDSESTELTNMKGRIPHDEKINKKKSCTSDGQSDGSDLKIMTVSSITEGAFSLQVDEGDCIRVISSMDDNDIHESHEGNTNLEKAKEGDDSVGFKLSSRKRKIEGSEIEKEFCKVTSKLNKSDDPQESSSKESREQNIDEGKKKSTLMSMLSVGKDNGMRSMRLKPRTKTNADIDNDVKLAYTSQNDVAFTSFKSGEESQEHFPFELKSTSSSTRGKFNLPNPDSSQDSITILRMLLHQPLETFEKKFCADSTLKKNTSVLKNGKTDQIHNTKMENEEKGNSLDKGFMCNPVLEHEQIVKTENFDEDEQTIDLSPPTLSPQAPTPTFIHQEISSGLTNQEINKNNCGLSTPNLASPDIVQFLDKAHQQIKDILNATETKNGSENLNGEFNSKPCRQTEEEKTLSSTKHSRKSRKPMKIVDDATIPVPSFEKLNHAFKESNDSNILKPPLRSIEQSDTQFPLLRLCLEQPMHHEAKLAMPAQNTSISSSSSSLRISPVSTSKKQSHSSSLSHSQPKVMENVTNSLEISSCDGEADIPENEKDVGVGNFSQSFCKGKQDGSRDDTSSSADRKEQFPSQSSLPKAVPSPLLTSQPTNILSQQPNTAVYHVEKDLVNDVVYQTLHVNSDKDGERTFTFADIPYVKNSSPSQSKNVKGSKQTSELNLGDYFPPGTLIPAKDIHLVTQQSSDGCDIIMKFCFSSNSSHT